MTALAPVTWDTWRGPSGEGPDGVRLIGCASHSHRGSRTSLQIFDVAERAQHLSRNVTIVLVLIEGDRGSYYEFNDVGAADEAFWDVSGRDVADWSGLLASRADYTSTGVFQPDVWFLRDSAFASSTPLTASDGSIGSGGKISRNPNL
jgi:hypothetical protein